MEPIDVILTLIPKLSEKELDIVRKLLGETACERSGHKFISAGEVTESIWKPPKKQFICTKCGLKIT